MKAVVVGCGYVGTRLAYDLLNSGMKVQVITKSSVPAVQGVVSIQLNIDNWEKSEKAGIRCDDAIVYYLVPPPREGVRDSRLEKFVDSVLIGSPIKFVLISTTGVYGDCKGDWVDESAPLNPATDQSRRRVDSERICCEWAAARNASLVILRVPAIYGPGRVPTKRLRAGLTLPSRSQCGFSNRIHVDDLVRVCRAAGEEDASGVFNVSDGSPMRMLDYFELVAEIWGLPKPATSETATDSLSDAMVAYLRDSRRIDNGRMLRELQPGLQYANVRDGLSMCFDCESASVKNS